MKDADGFEVVNPVLDDRAVVSNVRTELRIWGGVVDNLEQQIAWADQNGHYQLALAYQAGLKHAQQTIVTLLTLIK